MRTKNNRDVSGEFFNRQHLGALALAVCAAGCSAGMEDEGRIGETQDPLVTTDGLLAANIAPGGLLRNGLALTGSGSNGLTVNGLNQKGLSAAIAAGLFTPWFNLNLAQADLSMTNLVACACPSNARVSYTDSSSVQHTWSGELGLAPAWCPGSKTGRPAPASVTDQEFVSACLLAKVNVATTTSTTNAFNVSFQSSGLAAPSHLDKTAFRQQEGVFFGNIFPDAENAGYAATQSALAEIYEHYGRGCAIAGECSTLLSVVGTTMQACTESGVVDNGGQAYSISSCTAGGRTWNNVISVELPQDTVDPGIYDSTTLGGTATTVSCGGVLGTAGCTHDSYVTGLANGYMSAVSQTLYQSGGTYQYLTRYRGSGSLEFFLDGNSKGVYTFSNATDWQFHAMTQFLSAPSCGSNHTVQACFKNHTITWQGVGTTAPDVDAVLLTTP